jgi:hypothetical protein
MLNFGTLFDSNYLSRGLAMYHSLVKTGIDFHLYIFSFDSKSAEILLKMNYANITVISLDEFENKRLLDVKPSRSRAEYCWTCTPATVLHVFDHYDVTNCTYIDADLYFYSSPQVLFDEMGDQSVLITEHRYTPKYDRTEIAGKYCVQFMTFKKDKRGLKVLNWWMDACLEWCYDRYEDGKFGDQKYLDTWTKQFEGIHELKHLGGGMAPWNIQQYEFVNRQNYSLIFKELSSNEKFSAVFYHYHYVRFYKNDLVDLGWFSLSKKSVNSLYADYVHQLDIALKQIQLIEVGFKENLRPFSIFEAEGLKGKLKVIIKLIFKINLYKKLDLVNKRK